jgi:hypothetical protein
MYVPRQAAFFIDHMARDTGLPYPDRDRQSCVDILAMSDSDLKSEIDRFNRLNLGDIAIKVTDDFLNGLRKDVARMMERFNDGN